MNERKARRYTHAGLPGDSLDREYGAEVSVPSRPKVNKSSQLRRFGPTLLTAALFILVVWVGAELVYTVSLPPITKASKVVATVQARWIPTVAPTWTSTPTVTPTPTPTVTATPPSLPPVPPWFNQSVELRIAGIVAGETWSLTDTETLNFLATQIFYDAIRYNGVIPKTRWKAYKQPTHETLQAVDVALFNYDEPLWPRCAFVGGYADTDYFKRVSKYHHPDYTFGYGEHRVEGWGCK